MRTRKLISRPRKKRCSEKPENAKRISTVHGPDTCQIGVEGLFEKGTPAPALTGTGAGTARLAPPTYPRLPIRSRISTPYQFAPDTGSTAIWRQTPAAGRVSLRGRQQIIHPERMPDYSFSHAPVSSSDTGAWLTRKITQFFQSPRSGGRSRHGAPVRNIQNTALTNSLLSPAGRPTLPFLPGRCACIFSQTLSQISCRRCAYIASPVMQEEVLSYYS